MLPHPPGRVGLPKGMLRCIIEVVNSVKSSNVVRAVMTKLSLQETLDCRPQAPAAKHPLVAVSPRLHCSLAPANWGLDTASFRAVAVDARVPGEVACSVHSAIEAGAGLFLRTHCVSAR